MSPQMPRDPRRKKEVNPPPPQEDEYNDIEWDDDDEFGEQEDERELFQDSRLRGAISVTDWVTKRRLITIGSVIGVLFVLVTSISWYRSLFATSGPQGAEVALTVPEGTTLNSFASTLESNGVISSDFGFRVYLKVHDAPALQAGEYAFRKNSSPGQVISDIKKGPKEATDRLTIPEGFRLKQIAERVGRIPGFSETKFLEVANSGSIRSAYQPVNSKSLEGFLFPDTYTLSSRDTETTLIERMRNQFDSTVKALGIDRSERAIGHSPFETIVIASMIEAEAKVDVDRGKISQVIENRLDADMLLQIDATVLYGLGNTKTSLSKKDLDNDNPYNTYTRKGLPAGPIGSPGRKSLQAALNPTPGPWLFYVVVDANGAHAFTTDGKEHERIAKESRAKGLF
jgi:UPF0755 protein